MILEVSHIDTYYGLSHILFDVSLAISAQEVVVLLGRNGAGKTTTFRSIMGLTPPRVGRVFFNGLDITGRPAHRVARLGLGWVPEDRRIFPHLTVLENLEIARKKPAAEFKGDQSWTEHKVLKLFPVLEAFAHRRGGTLSGGEQQMLTIARTLMGNPQLLLLDEPTEGLAPLIIRAIGELMEEMKKSEVTMLLSEQNVKFSLSAADRAYIIDDGRIVYQGRTQELKENPEIMKRYLAV